MTAGTVSAVRVVNIPVVQQRQVQPFMLCRRSRRSTDSVPTVQTVQKTEEISQVRFLDKVVEMTVVVQHQVSMVQVVQKQHGRSQVDNYRTSFEANASSYSSVQTAAESKSRCVHDVTTRS